MVPGRVSGSDDFPITRVVIGERFHFRLCLRILSPKIRFSSMGDERRHLRFSYFKGGRFAWNLKAV